VLKYVNRAIAHTDVPEALPEFIGQRRRWLNGSFFAATYAIVHAGQILRSGHSIPRKFVLALQVVYNVVNLTFSWFNVVSFDSHIRRVPINVCASGQLLLVFCAS
jgi:chitin synthase